MAVVQSQRQTSAPASAGQPWHIVIVLASKTCSGIALLCLQWSYDMKRSQMKCATCMSLSSFTELRLPMLVNNRHLTMTSITRSILIGRYHLNIEAVVHMSSERGDHYTAAALNPP